MAPPQFSGTAGTVSVLLELLAKGAFTFDPPTRVVVPHPLRITDLLHVVDRDVEPFAQPPGACVAPGPAAGPLSIGGDQDDRDVGNSGFRLHERLHTGVLGHPLVQIAQIGRGILLVAATRLTATPKLVEQSHLGPAPFSLSP